MVNGEQTEEASNDGPCRTELWLEQLLAVLSIQKGLVRKIANALCLPLQEGVAENVWKRRK